MSISTVNPSPARPLLRRACASALLTVVALLLCACTTTGPNYPGPSALESGHWKKVMTNPPTYFPKGMPRSHPTNARDGFWILAGDAADNRFFVPTRSYGNFTRTQLETEAKAAIPPDLLRRQARKERRRNFWTTLFTPSKGDGSPIENDCHDSSFDDDRESRKEGGNCPPPDTCPTDGNCPVADHCPTGDNPGEE